MPPTPTPPMPQAVPQDAGKHFILAFLFPLGGLIDCLYNWRQSWAKNVFWIVCIYLGAIHVYCPEGEILGTGSDAGRYVLRLMEMHSADYTFMQLFREFQTSARTIDLYQNIINFIISRFTDNGHILFAVLATIFGFFYSRNIWYILERLPAETVKKNLILVALFFLACTIVAINGARMWTALHVYVYALLPYLVEGKKTRLWWLFAPPFIHFSFLYVVLFAIAYVLVPDWLKRDNRTFLIGSLIIFIISLFVSSLNLSQLAITLTKYSPAAYSQRIGGYVSERLMEVRAGQRAGLNWYVRWSSKTTFWCISSILLAIFPAFSKEQTRKDLNRLYVFALLIGALVNVMSLIPSGWRFRVLGRMFHYPIILLTLSQISVKDIGYKITTIASWILLLPLVVNIRRLCDDYSITIFGNFITVFFWENNVLLISYVKGLFGVIK